MADRIRLTQRLRLVEKTLGHVETSLTFAPALGDDEVYTKLSEVRAKLKNEEQTLKKQLRAPRNS